MVGGNFVELRSLMDGFAGEVHIGLGLHHQALLAPEADDVIGRFELHFVQFHVQLFRKQIHREKAHIVAGVLIFLAGIAQAHDQPAVILHGLEQIRNGGAAVDMLDGPGKHVGNIQELDLVAGGIANLGNGVQEDHFLNGALLDPLVGGAGQHTVGGAGIDLFGTADFHQSVGGVAQRTGSSCPSRRR